MFFLNLAKTAKLTKKKKKKKERKKNSETDLMLIHISNSK